METVCEKKFQNREMSQLINATYPFKLGEGGVGNDKWGINDDNEIQVENWKGTNLAGNIWMKIR